MSGLFGQSEKVNNILFVLILILFVMSSFLLSGMFKLGELLNVRFETDVILLSSSLSANLLFFVLFFSSIIFGYVSKNPKKTFLLGFLIWTLPFCISIIRIIIRQTSVSDVFLTNYPILALLSFINGILMGVAGYFVAVNHPDKNRRILYRILPLVLILITIYLFLVSASIGGAFG